MADAPSIVAARIERLLGRRPRGLRGVAVMDGEGEPVVVRVALLVDNKPFPTLYWLVDPVLGYAIDRVEAGGLVARLQETIDASSALQRRLVADHRSHIRLRRYCASDAEWSRIETLDFTDAFLERGIGGIADRRRVRCLHAWYAAHLVVPNTVGTLLERHWAQSGAFEPLRRREACSLIPEEAGLSGFLEG